MITIEENDSTVVICLDETTTTFSWSQMLLKAVCTQCSNTYQ